MTCRDFLNGCLECGYTEGAVLSSPEQLFEWLDTDMSGVLTYEDEIKWLDMQEWGEKA